MSQGSEPAASAACGRPTASASTVTSAESAARVAVLNLENTVDLLDCPTYRSSFDRNTEPSRTCFFDRNAEQLRVGAEAQKLQWRRMGNPQCRGDCWGDPGDRQDVRNGTVTSLCTHP